MKSHRLLSHGVTCLTPKHPKIKALKKSTGAASFHGDKVWDASFVLMDFLSIDGLPSGSRVLDIGCGWGPLTCYLNKAHQARVISIDADDAVKPYLHLHAQENEVPVHFWQRKIDQLSVEDLSVADYIMGGDICFWDSLRDDWKKLIKRAKEAGVKQLYLADPGRSPFNELVDWAADRFDVEFWEHDIVEPIESEHYILQVNF